jgi:predicted kinase
MTMVSRSKKSSSKKEKCLKEITKLKKGLDRSIGGKGTVIFLECYTEAGASQVKELLANYSSLKIVNFLSAKCSIKDKSKPFKGVARLLQQYFQDRMMVRQEVIDYIQEAPYLMVGALPFLDEWRSSWGGFDMLGRDTINQEIVNESKTVFNSILNLIKLMAEDRPLIMCLDGGEWVDNASISLLHDLSKKIGKKKIFIGLGYDKKSLGNGGVNVPKTISAMERENRAITICIDVLMDDDLFDRAKEIFDLTVELDDTEEEVAHQPEEMVEPEPPALSENIYASRDPGDLAYDIWMKSFKINLLNPAINPKLYILSGLPLSGKTYLAKRIIERSSVDIVYIENDNVRGLIIKELGLEKPQYIPEEHRLVFDISHELIWIALSFSYHTIFDATNLNEKYRKDIYRIADSINADILVIKTVIDHETAERRSRKKFERGEMEGHSKADISIYELLSKEDEDIDNCSRPYLVLDTAKKSSGWYINKHKLALME